MLNHIQHITREGKDCSKILSSRTQTRWTELETCNWKELSHYQTNKNKNRQLTTATNQRRTETVLKHVQTALCHDLNKI